MNLFDPLNHEPAYRKVAAAIERKILERSLRTGDRLPAETSLAQQFGVNRSTVREALRELETHGLVGRQSGSKKLFVTRPMQDRVASGVSRALALNGVTFLELWEAMMIIEPAAARHAAGRRSDEELDSLERLVAAVAASTDGGTAVPLVVEFFATIVRASHNQVLTTAQDPLNRLLAPTLSRMIDQVPQARARITSAQRKITAAIREQQAAQAEEWMAKHIRDFKRGYELAGIELEYRVPPG
ncbi:MAG TPA: GntR family transcriptional regulator [Steroidobacteraceae bacterium]|nr:GntR family transcriptional regulator [Steroidobacteraceae bacterium]